MPKLTDKQEDKPITRSIWGDYILKSANDHKDDIEDLIAGLKSCIERVKDVSS